MSDEQSVSPEDVVRLTRPYSGAAGKLVIAGWGLYLLSMLLPAIEHLFGVEMAILVAVWLFKAKSVFTSGDYAGVILGNITNLLMLASPLFMIRKSRLGLWISSALMVLPALYLAAIFIILEGGFIGFRAGFYVWWLSFGVVAGGLATRAAMLPASAPPFSLPRFSLRTLILFTVAFGIFVAAVSKPTVITVLMALTALVALIGSILIDRKRLR